MHGLLLLLRYGIAESQLITSHQLSKKFGWIRVIKCKQWFADVNTGLLLLLSQVMGNPLWTQLPYFQPSWIVKWNVARHKTVSVCNCSTVTCLFCMIRSEIRWIMSKVCNVLGHPVLTCFSALLFPSLSSESIETQLHGLGQHLCTLLLDDGECHLQEHLLSMKNTPFIVPDNYLPSCPHMTQHYLEQLPVMWCRLHCALPSFDILCSYTYSTDYQHQLQNSSQYFWIMTFTSVIFEWPKYQICGTTVVYKYKKLILMLKSCFTFKPENNITLMSRICMNMRCKCS